jgi:putative ABC transport system permease protein
MRLASILRQRLRSLFLRNKVDEELDEELRYHLERQIEQEIATGKNAEEAHYAALRAIGALELRKEECRDARGVRLVETALGNLRFGVRMLRKTPVWTLVISLTLACGVGLSTAIFSIFYAALLQPLPYPDADRLVALWLSAPRSGYARFYVNAALWLDWRRNSAVLKDIALTRPIANFNLTGEGTPERLQGARTSFNLPLVLRVKPLLGRTFTEQEQQSDARVAILSYAFWRRRFGGDPAILGRKIELNGEPFEVIGIMPPDYQYPSAQFELWTPLYIPPDEIVLGMNNSYLCVGRLKTGTTIQQAQAELARLMRRLADEYPASYGSGNDRVTALVVPLSQSDAFQIRNMLYALLGAVACLLLIGCMNLAVLLIARASARAQEVAVRIALGASAARLRSQFLAEVMPLSAFGIAGGLLLAWSLLRLLMKYMPAEIPHANSIGLHGPVIAFSVGISLAIVLMASLLPGRLAANCDPGRGLQQASRSVTSGGRARNFLVIAQIALTLMLLLGGLLFARSFSALLQVQPGFSTEEVLTMHLVVTRAKYREDERVADYYRRILERLNSIPGVIAAGLVNRLPFSGIAQTGGLEFEGRAGHYDSDWRSATPRYFEAMGIPLIRGRVFQDSDRPQTTSVGLIDERLARLVFGTESPIGKRFRRYLPSLSPQDPWTVIVGVVGHILNDNLEQDPRPQVYWPETQRTQDRGALVIRTVGDPEAYTRAVVGQIHKEDSDQPVYDIRTMKQWIDRTLERRTLLTGMVALFAGASLLLACIGLYGVVSYTVSLRLREFGIRMALGARAGNVCALVLSHAGRLALCGCAIGLIIAWPVCQAVQSLLFGIRSSDLVSWLFAPALLLSWRCSRASVLPEGLQKPTRQLHSARSSS